MIFTSPLPPVRVPTTPLTPYILERASQRAGKTAFVDGATGRTMTYGELDDAVRRLAGGWSTGGLAKGDVVAIMAPNCPEYGVAVPRRRARRRCHHHDQPDVHRAARSTISSTTRARPVPRDGPDVPRDGHGRDRGHVRRGDLRDRRGDDGYPSLTSIVRRAARGPGAGRSRRRRRAALLVGHDRPVEGRHAHAPQPRREHRADPRRRSRCSEDDTFIAVLPFFHIYGMQVLMNTGLRAGATIVTMPRFDLEQFLQLHQEHRHHALVRRAADRRRAREASDRRQLRPLRAASRSSRARRRCRPSSRSSAASASAARSCRATA